MEKLENTMKGKGIADTTINLYITKLIQLNNKRPFSNLAFLKNTGDIGKKLDKHENFNTKRSYLTAIVSILTHGGAGENKNYKELNMHYRGRLNDVVEQIKEIPAGTKTKKQEQNWLDWKDVLDIHRDLANKTSKYDREAIEKSLIKRRIWSMYVLLSVYVLAPPRRNKDYMMMKYGNNEDDNFNWYDGKFFHFNVFKTAKTYGAEKFEASRALRDVLDRNVELFDIKENDYLILNEDGSQVISSSGITKQLNRIFAPKKISSSMLRHIYLTDKYGDVKEEMAEDAKAMGHSVSMQRDYVVE
jgi:hypothetical protein